MKKIGLSGKFVSGKTTIANELVKLYGYKRVAIADNIKFICNKLIKSQFTDNNKKDTLYNFFTNKIKLDSYASDELVNNLFKYFNDFIRTKKRTWIITDNEFFKNDDYRELTQVVGTIVRDMYGVDVWVKWYIKAIENEEKIICDDVRLKTEKEHLENNGFTIIRLDITKETQNKRHKALYGTLPDEERRNHFTEIDLDNTHFDIRIDNNGEIDYTLEIINEKIMKNQILTN